MKTTFSSILFVLVTLFNFTPLFAEVIGVSTIYTKGGKAVEVFFCSDMDSISKVQYNAEYQKEFPNATILASSTAKYNCHSYAWNLSDGGTTVCWINTLTTSDSPNVSNYWTDGYYYETTEANAKKIHYYKSDHSAIVSATVPGMYESKWGAMPLMRHAPNYGPYMNMDKRNYYRGETSTPDPTPSVITGLITCSEGSGEIGIGVAADYYAEEMKSHAYSSMECVIETPKGDDVVEKGYAVINHLFKNGANVTFTRSGMYEMFLRFYNQSHQLVAEFTFEPIVSF